ncbi:MAG: iron ABC transporter permease [Chloroflexota bacterium]|nr:iron ABC transporter permease [Chloroflexota bacterium]
MNNCRFAIVLILLTFVLLGIIIISLGMGAVFIPPDRVLAALINPAEAGTISTDVTIVRELRLPRSILAATIGAGLAIAGAAFQGLFRNPLADPFVVGASSGASLGATLAIIMGLNWHFAGFGSVPLAAFIGALLAVFTVYSIAEIGGATPAISLLLAGAALSTLLSALVSLLMLTSHDTLHEVFSWTMGGLSGRSWPHLLSSGPYMVIGLIALWLMARPLDALASGDETAQSLGLPIRKARGVIVAAASLATAAAVAAGGVIGFVGLIAPHLARMMFGAQHHRVLPASMIIGAMLLLLADDLARTVVAPLELPVGIVTSLLGGTFFLYLLKSRGQSLRG